MDAEYFRIHEWLIRHHGKATKCENELCKSRAPKRFEWALLKGKDYKKDRNNYIQLCPSCHRKYDYTEVQRQNQRTSRKKRLERGDLFTAQYRANLSKAMKGVNAIPVFKLSNKGEFIQEYKSVSIAATENNILQSSISNVLTGRAKTAGGYKWEYKQAS
jgi:hypothetical protein